MFQPVQHVGLLKLTQRLKPMPPIQKNHRRSFIVNARGFKWSGRTRLGTGRRGGGCKEECLSRVIEPIRRERLYNVKNVGFAYIGD